MGWRFGCVAGRGVGIGVVCGVEILSIGADVEWYIDGVVVLGDVSICVMRGMMWSGIGGSLGVLEGAVKRFLQLSKFLILFGQVFCPTKSCFHLLYLGLSDLLLSSYLLYLLCVVVISQHPCILLRDTFSPSRWCHGAYWPSPTCLVVGAAVGKGVPGQLQAA